MKKFGKVCLLLSFVFVFSFSLCLVGCGPKKSDNNKIKNVIVLIGDGMGINHVKNAQKFFGADNIDFAEEYVCSVETKSLNSGVTDSAAAATALATGNKVNNGEVSSHDGVDLKHIMEIAKENGKKTGIITTDALDGATPACYSSHVSNRSDSNGIIADQLASGIDLFVGGSVDNGSYSLAHSGQKFVDNGYVYYDNSLLFRNLDKTKKVIGRFDNMRSKYNTSINHLPDEGDMEDIIESSLEFLDNQNGFCLMIENAFIDKCSHSGDLYGALCEVREFADMVDEVMDYFENRDDTAIIVTADHETGGLTLAKNKNQLSNSLFTSNGAHTGANVGLYVEHAYIKHGKSIDNTQIFELCKELVENKKYLFA